MAPQGEIAFATFPKVGPRHATVDVLAYDARTGALSPLQNQTCLPAGFAGEPNAVDIHLSPDGALLYASERASSTLASFRVDVVTGRIEALGHTPTETQPRGFAIDPSGRFLIAAGQRSHSATLYAIEHVGGSLTPLRRYPLGENPSWVEIVRLP